MILIFAQAVVVSQQKAYRHVAAQSRKAMVDIGIYFNMHLI